MRQESPGMIDSFGRRISYVRLSVTDRCNLRCHYCMAERMQFMPRADLLSLKELVALADIFIARGVSRLRLTGGEPLVRHGILDLVRELGKRLGRGLDEVTLTTNGTQLESAAGPLQDAGVRRINISLDTLDAERFRHITRGGDLEQVIRGIDAAREAGLAVKINMVALKCLNEDEIEPMLRWCDRRGLDLTLIETMPLGQVGADRTDHYLPLDTVKRKLDQRFTLSPVGGRTGGPARYFDVAGLRSKLGLITPLSDNFCEGCNRVRVTASGTVFGCLGHDQKVELRHLLRDGGTERVNQALDELLAGKPKRHDFRIADPVPAVGRHMSVTGG
jgi:cyclic pyranopterin phosphate synthase